LRQDAKKKKPKDLKTITKSLDMSGGTSREIEISRQMTTPSRPR